MLALVWKVPIGDGPMRTWIQSKKDLLSFISLAQNDLGIQDRQDVLLGKRSNMMYL